jgi:hypothetical protein
MNPQNIARACALIGEAHAILESEINAVPVPPIVTPPIITPPTNPNPVVYGRGSYTDSADPRAQNARRHWSNGGKVLAQHIQVHTQPQKLYRVTDVRLIDELEAGGNHVARVNQIGGSEMVGLFTGYNGEIDHFDDVIRHAPREEVVIDGGFMPPNLGPLAIALIDASGMIMSDVVASLGLPGNAHVCYVITFERR